MLKPLAQATGGDARRVVDGSSVELPRIVPVRASSVFRGDGWMGVRMRDASVVRGVGVLPMFAGLIGLLLLLGAFRRHLAARGPLIAIRRIARCVNYTVPCEFSPAARSATTVDILRRSLRCYIITSERPGCPRPSGVRRALSA